MTRVFNHLEHRYYVELCALIAQAKTDGIHLTIETERRFPLAMGNYDMKPGVRVAREAQRDRLWMLNIEGPDDIVAAPSYIEAVKVQAEFNAYWAEVKSRHPSPDHYPTLIAVIHEWDGTREDHAASVAEYWADYQGYDNALAALLRADF